MSKATPTSPSGELTEPAPAPVALEGAGLSVGQKTVSTPAAQEPPVPLHARPVAHRCRQSREKVRSE
jgi:hypothetical protein